MISTKNTEIVPADGTLVPGSDLESWEKALLDSTREAAAALGVEVAKLSLRGRTWKVEQEVYGDFCDVVIACFAPYRSHYVQAYEAGGEPSKPDCWATARILSTNGLPDSNEDNLRAHHGVTDRHSPACIECEFNKFGSALYGGRGKGCGERIKVAVLVVGGEKTGAIADPRLTTSALLDLSSTARPAFRKYVQRLADMKIPYFSVISRISFDPRRDFPSPIWTPTDPVPSPFKSTIRELVMSGPRLVTQSPWALRDVPDDRESRAPALKKQVDLTVHDLPAQPAQDDDLPF